MGSWVSKDGVWNLATERVVVYDKNGDPHIYEGPDRSAAQYLKETGESHLGMPFYEFPEIIERAHERKQTVDEFCKTSIHTAEKREKDYKEKAAVKVNHKLPQRREMSKQSQSGGINTAGSGSLYGGFGGSKGSALGDAIESVKNKK